MRPGLWRAYTTGLGVLAIGLSLTAKLGATVGVNAPEIDGSSVTVGLGLLTAGVLILRARWRSK